MKGFMNLIVKILSYIFGTFKAVEIQNGSQMLLQVINCLGAEATVANQGVLIQRNKASGKLFFDFGF